MFIFLSADSTKLEHCFLNYMPFNLNVEKIIENSDFELNNEQ